MGNGKKINRQMRSSAKMAKVEDEAALSEPQDYVVVFTYSSEDGSVEEEFAKMIEDVKALHSFKQNVRVYAVSGESAKNVLAQLEKPADS
jgi:exo-beta-1,3-glucanase (GH17 family)